MNYQPKPMDLNREVLPQEMLQLEEVIAENVHDLWAYNRMQEGWCYGEVFDGKCKRHPDLVPYEELSEGEKAYDRTTAMNTLKLIQALGYKIIKEER